jgi:DNA-binding response OmpR family regulator
MQAPLGGSEFGKAIWDVLGERRSPRIVFEHPGEDTIPTSIFACDNGGMVVICAGTTGFNAVVDLRYLWTRQKRFQARTCRTTSTRMPSTSSYATARSIRAWHRPTRRPEDDCPCLENPNQLMTDARQIRLMIVDDHAVVRSGLSAFLLAYEDLKLVGEARDGEEGVRLCRNLNPDVVLMDLVMPGMDGWEVCESLRRLSVMPILMLTARTEEADRVRGLNLGGDDYVAKPFSLLELIARVGALLRRAQQRQARTLLLRQIPLSEASTDGMAGQLLELARHGLPLDEGIRAARRYLEITPQEVQEIVEKVMHMTSVSGSYHGVMNAGLR